MDTINFFLLHHNRLYFEPGGIFQRIDGLTDEQIKNCPYKMNSIAWLLWHIARCEDVGINRIIYNRTQVLDENNWQERLNLFRRDFGTGMTPEELSTLNDNLNITSLREYVNAVAVKTESVIREINPAELNEVPDSAHLNSVLFDEGVLKKNDNWVADIYSGKTRGWFLGHLGLTHGKGHLGQILIIRKLQGLGSGGR